jgi:hypothetical protein
MQFSEVLCQECNGKFEDGFTVMARSWHLHFWYVMDRKTNKAVHWKCMKKKLKAARAVLRAYEYAMSLVEKRVRV